jgi:hypothetical protein
MLKSIGITVFLCLAGIVVATALAQPQEEGKGKAQFKTLVKQVKKEQKQLPPIHLPDIGAASKALWKADRSTLGKQYVASNNVIRFWHNKGLDHGAKEKCWMFLWQRSCTVARKPPSPHHSGKHYYGDKAHTRAPLRTTGVCPEFLPKDPSRGTERLGVPVCLSHRGGRGFVMNHEFQSWP